MAGAANAVQKSFRNVSNSISFSLLREYETTAAARAALLALAAAIPDGVADAVIESADGESYTLRAARITAAEPRIEAGRRVACDFSLTGGKLDTGTDSTDGLGDTAALDSAEDGDTSAL